jgi:hypothetical protein
LFRKPLSHIAVLTGTIITLLHKLLKPGQLIDHYGVVPANSQASNEDLYGIISLMVSTISKQETYLYVLHDGYFIFKPVLGWVAICFAFQFKVLGCGRAKTL